MITGASVDNTCIWLINMYCFSLYSTLDIDNYMDYSKVKSVSLLTVLSLPAHAIFEQKLPVRRIIPVSRFLATVNGTHS